MKVKWHSHYSSPRDFYLSKSNDNADCVEEDKRFMFVNDLSFLEIIYLLNVGLSSYNVCLHVPSDIPTHNQVVNGDNLKTKNIYKRLLSARNLSVV